MSDWTVHLEFQEANSSKFWRARVEGKTLYVNYGKIGSNGQTQVKDLTDPAAAKREYDKLVAEKRKKGYVDSGSAGSAPAEADDADEGDDADDEDSDEDERPARKPASKRAPAPTAPPATKAAPVAAPAAPAAAPRSTPGHRLVLDAGGRKVETTLYLDGQTLRMESQETHATAEAARKAFERLKQLLAGEGFQAG
ncbi:MAG TPA: WGR domain-containing protein [Kofleriaceae bacterium]|jgi:predicted DNA-binding WGR domain protein|nr:WGR domain-containing protein [Kofleriaceae bacterium]